jgi:hypothetical protein
MKLKFYARDGHVVHFPGPKMAGQIHNYVGRQFVLEPDDKLAQSTRVMGKNIALKDGFEIDSETAEGRDMMHEARCGGLWPANAETATACGCAFVAVKYDDQALEFVPSIAAIATQTKPSPTKSE